MLAFNGKVAVVTGATSGIGARTAELFVATGARVVIAGRRQDKGEKLAAALGDAASFIRTDVCVEADVKAMIDHAVRRFGRIDCLFNNAGTLPSGAGIADIELADFDAAIAVHVRSVLAGMKHAAPIMIRQGSGSIINMSSIVGIRAGIGSVAYSTAPGGLQVRTRSGLWVDVEPVPRSFTVNIGDLMQMWTNDRWVSTLHRVGNPPPGAVSSRRQSIAFFHQPNYDALISCIETCFDRAHPPKFEPITSGEHMGLKIRRMMLVESPAGGVA